MPKVQELVEMFSFKDKKLFTPGPLGCSAGTKEAMLRDLGSRDTEFIQVNMFRHQLVSDNHSAGNF